MGNDQAIYNLAIETSCRMGSVSLGRGDQLLQTAAIPQPHRHALELIPTIDRTCKEHDVLPKQIGQVYVSIGPGSFTGLRIAVATAKMFARTMGTRLVAVPTIEVVVHNVFANRSHVAVCLNTKHDTMYVGVYRCSNDVWSQVLAPQVMTADELCSQAPMPFAVLGEHLPDYDWPENVELLDTALAVPRNYVVWRLGRQMADRGEFTEPSELLPLYARPPEAVTVWENRKTGN